MGGWRHSEAWSARLELEGPLGPWRGGARLVRGVRLASARVWLVGPGASGPQNPLAQSTELVGWSNGVCQGLWALGYRGGFGVDANGVLRARFRKRLVGPELGRERDGLERLFAQSSMVTVTGALRSG